MRASGLKLESLNDWRMIFWFLMVLLLSAPLGFMLAVFPGCVVLSILHHVRMLANGGPFYPGDLVQIICGPKAGTVASVYSEWQGDSVRVDLGPDAQERFEDVFTPTELLRVDLPATEHGENLGFRTPET